MMVFTSFADFALHLSHLEQQQERELQRGLRKVARLVQKAARKQFGKYQPAVGGFQAWPELADATKEDRVQQGYSENDPLLRSGKTRDSIRYTLHGDTAVIGSDSDVMVWQELGTETIPPRPVLGPALVKNTRSIEEILGSAAARGLLPPGYVGPPSSPRASDYEFDT